MSVLGDAIRLHARRDPDGLAIDGGAHGRVNWAALEGQVAAMMARLSVADGHAAAPVASLLDQGIAQCLVDIALAETGAPALPLPLFFTEAQRAHALVQAGAGALIEGDVRAGHLRGIAIRLLAHGPAALPRGTARISFTSGSTGAPKGICLSAGHLAAVARAVVDFVGDRHAGRHLALLPPGILLETVAGFHATLLAGGTYVALPQAEVGLGDPFRPDFARMAQAIAEQRATSLILVPEYLAGIVAAMEATGLRLPALTLVAVGGARLSPALIERAVAAGLPVRQGYGLTECGSVVALEDGTEAARGSVGRTIGLNRLTLAPDGEILIEGLGHLGTIGNPRGPGALHTGDIGRLDADGRLWIEGRKSSLIVTSHGRNISPEWVEGQLLAQPGIVQAMVHGDGEAALGALVVPASPRIDVGSAVEAANGALPPYARVRHWRVVAPFTPANGQLTGNGRLRREAVASTYLKGREKMPFFDQLVARTRDAQATLAAVPQLQAGLAGRIDRLTYIAYLTQAYHHVRHTVPLMEETRARLAHRPALVAALDAYVAEETGHEGWILADIDAAGGDSRVAAASRPSDATAAMVNHAYDVIRHGNPVAFFGMVYVLEGTSIAMASSGAAAVRSALGLPPEAFTYLASHGALDQEHMRFFADLMNRIEDEGDQEAIIAMARDMFRLFAGLFAAIPVESADEAA